MKLYPYEKKGRGVGGKRFKHDDGGGGHNKFWGGFNMGA